MSIDEPSVALKVSCSAAGGDEFAIVPDQLTLTITPRVMEHLEKLLAYQKQALALYEQSFPDHKAEWSTVDVMFDAFEPTCLLGANAGGERDCNEDQSDEPEADMRIDCKSILLGKSDFSLTANMRNASTEVKSDLITYATLQRKFGELRMLLRSIETGAVVSSAIDESVSAAGATSRRPTGGMSL